MKLSAWAKLKGISYQTAYIWFKKGQIPNSIQMDSGTILIDNDKPVSTPNQQCVIYCRVSNQSRKAELDYQVKRCEEFCASRGLQITKVYKEVASGMNDNRKQLNALLEQKPNIIVVENKDRLTRFGFNYLKLLLAQRGAEIIVINVNNEDEKDLFQDLVSIITSFCCRLYGLRRAKNKADKIKQIIEYNESDDELSDDPLN